MDFSFLRNLFSTTGTGASSIGPQLEQSSSILADDGKCKIEEYDDEFEIIEEDYEFINPRDPNEPHSLPSSYQIDESIAEIAGFNKEKLLEMCTFSKMTYGNNDTKLSQAGYKTKAEFFNEGYNIIPFYYSDGRHAGFVSTKGEEITIAYRGTKDLYDVMIDMNAMLSTSEFSPEGGRMHSGFYNSFKDSWNSLYKILNTHAKEQKSEIKDLKINLTGHSMGGAIAKIAALYLNKTESAEDVHVATFGDPRVFDLDASKFYNEALQEKTIRVTQHRQDPVPAVAPGFLGYVHVGAQLRVEAPPTHGVHKIDGYYQAINNMEEKDFKSNNSVSLFYYPVRALSRINSAVLGNVQYCVANAVNYMVGGSNFFEEVKNKNSSQLEQAEVESSLSTARSV
ncbi:lipase family protein [Wolbachia endosymbiont of Anurida maritima]|uniref:lipase family protein n=1 Tax=Wolbachia endosymbiont of Anurida maritima TaxID=2850562 RepID=UPI0035CF39BC